MSKEQLFLEQKPIETKGRKIDGRFSVESGGALISVEIPGLTGNFEALGENWKLKNEFHVTLIGQPQKIACVFKDKYRHTTSNKKARTRIKEAIRTTGEEKSFLVHLSNDLRIARRDESQSLIAMCEVEGAEDFFQDLEDKLKIPIERPPFHITLYTLENEKPIGIYTKSQLEKYSRPLTSAEAEKIDRMMNYSIRGNTYAWGKTSRNLTEKHLLKVLEKDGAFVGVDLCSSTPIYKGIMISRHINQCRKEAVHHTGAFTNDLSARKKIPFLETISEDQIKELRLILLPKKSEAREIIHASLQDLIYYYPDSISPDNKEDIKSFLEDKFNTSTKIYEIINEPEGKPGDKGTWYYFLESECQQTLSEILENILGDRTAEFIPILADYFAERLCGNLKRFSFSSLDLRDFDEIALNAKQGFSQRFRNTRFFQSTLERRSNHIQANIRHLPFEKESVSFYSMIEGWPFYDCGFNRKDFISVAEKIAETLKPGGAAVIFPWFTNRKNRENLLEVEKYWKCHGLKISKESYTKEELFEKMGDRELTLADHSPVFKKNRDVFEVMILEKIEN